MFGSTSGKRALAGPATTWARALAWMYAVIAVVVAYHELTAGQPVKALRGAVSVPLFLMLVGYRFGLRGRAVPAVGVALFLLLVLAAGVVWRGRP